MNQPPAGILGVSPFSENLDHFCGSKLILLLGWVPQNMGFPLNRYLARTVFHLRANPERVGRKEIRPPKESSIIVGSAPLEKLSWAGFEPHALVDWKVGAAMCSSPNSQPEKKIPPLQKPGEEDSKNKRRGQKRASPRSHAPPVFFAFWSQEAPPEMPSCSWGDAKRWARRQRSHWAEASSLTWREAEVEAEDTPRRRGAHRETGAPEKPAERTQNHGHVLGRPQIPREKFGGTRKPYGENPKPWARL